MSTLTCTPKCQAQNHSVAEWLHELHNSKRFHSFCANLMARTELSIMTPFEEIATLSFLIERLQTGTVVEIGTFFAITTRIMAEAIAAAGGKVKLITLDPFGGHRVPSIIETWPEPLRQFTEFKPISSMDYFQGLETAWTPKGSESPFQLFFVDGHHNLEYALFDIVRSADHLKPGGVIVLDNMEQNGPRQAALQFLRWNPAWSLYVRGVVYDASVSDAELDKALEGSQGWGILISPKDIPVTRTARKFAKAHIPYQSIHGLKLNIRDQTGPGQVVVSLHYFAIPFDYHISGTGMVYKEAACTSPCMAPDSSMVAWFEQVVELELGTGQMNVQYELELTFIPDDPQGYMLLDFDCPYEFATEPLSPILSTSMDDRSDPAMSDSLVALDFVTT